MKRQKIGDICPKDLWIFAFKCLGRIFFPLLLLSPLIVIWRIFFYAPENFWYIVRLTLIYIMAVSAWEWLTSYKTIFEYNSEVLFIIKKRCFIFENNKKQIPLKEIKQITFAEIKDAPKKQSKLAKIFHMKLIYSLIYKLAKLLLNRGKLNICIICDNLEKIFIINDIKKNDERYLYLKELQKKIKTELKQ